MPGMEVTGAKLVSLGIASVYVLGSLVALGGAAALMCCFLLVSALALIWIPDELGGLLGFGRGPAVDQESPEMVLCGIGWAMLAAIPFALYSYFAAA
jgi:hypothetical protein